MKPASSLGDVIRGQIARGPGRAAMLFGQRGQAEFQTLTYRDLGVRIRQFAHDLQAMGLQRGERLAIFAENAPEWMILDLACQCLGVVSVPIFATVIASQAQYIARDSGARYIVCGTPDLAAKLPDFPTRLLSDMGTGPEMAETEWNAHIDGIARDDLATIIYTSGTTGDPKGAMIAHDAIVNVIEVVPQEIELTEADVFFSFLPISHVYERVAGQYLPLGIGASVGYARNLASIGADFMKVRPTVMMCVPRFLESFRDRVLDSVAKAPPFRQFLFRWAMSQGLRRVNGQFAPLAGVLDRLVLAKIRERTGGRMRYFVSGGAALPRAVAEFYMASGLTVLQGYGLTETSGASVVNRPARNRYWTVGEPIGCEVRLAEDGEILMRGPGIMKGYWNLPEATAECLSADGWFATGDIGEWEGKSLKITDRKKDILVLANGKNVAPQPLENHLRESRFISEALILGDGQEYCYALIVPNADAVAAELGPQENLADNPEVRKLIKREVDAFNRNVAPYEAVKRFVILSTPFSVEGGELTPTLKVRRKFVREKYAAQISAVVH